MTTTSLCSVWDELSNAFYNFMSSTYDRWQDEYKYEHDEFKEVLSERLEKVSSAIGLDVQLVRMSSSSRYWLDIAIEGTKGTFRMSVNQAEFKIVSNQKETVN